MSFIGINSTPFAALANETQVPFFISRWDWIVPVAIDCVLIILGLWILISLVHYGVKTGKWNKKRRRNSEKFSVGLIYTSVIASAVAYVLHPVTALVYMNVGFRQDEDELCEIIGDLLSFNYAAVVLAVQMFYWFRQRVFFCNQMLNVKYSKPVKFLSFSSVVVLYTAGTCVLLFLIVPDNFHWDRNHGCLYVPIDELQIGYWICVFFTVVFCQMTLLGLFLYAIHKSGKNKVLQNCCIKSCCIGCHAKTEEHNENGTSDEAARKRNIFVRSSTIFSSSSSLAEDPDKVQLTLCKTFVFATLSLMVDFFYLGFVFYIADKNTHRRISVLIGSTDLFLQLLFVLLSFAKWKAIMTSLFKRSSRL